MNSEQLTIAAILCSPAIYLALSKSKWNLIIASYLCVFCSLVIGFLIALANGFMGQQTKLEALHTILLSVGASVVYVCLVLLLKRNYNRKHTEDPKSLEPN